VPGACTKNAGSTYNRIGGCYPGDQVTATNRIQHGCAALCSGNTQFSGDGICVNLDAQGNGVCQYPNIQQCPAGPPQTVTFCQGDDLMQNTTSYAPKCTQPNLNPVDAPTCTPNNVIESFDGYPQGPFAPDGTPPQRFAGSRRLVTAASGWKIIVGGTTTSVDVRNEAGWPGNRLRISDNVNAFGTGTHYAAIQRKIRKSDSGSIEFDIYSRNTTLYAGQNGYYTPNFIIQLWELSGGYGFQEFYLNAMGMVTDGTKALGHFSFNRWHHVRIDWTQAGYDFYLDETKLNAQPIRTPPNTGAFNVTQVEFWVSERPYSQSYQTFPPVDIDNVKFPGCAGGCQPPTTTVNSVRLQTCLDGCFEGTCIQPTPTPTPTITPTPTPSITPTPVPLCRTPPRIAKFGGSSTTNINSLLSNPLAELRSVNGFTLDAPGAFKATYRSAVRICGQDIDANVTFGPGWFSINHDALDSSLVRPTQPISVILSYPSTIRNPAIYYAAGVFSDAAQIRQNGEVCPPTQCRNVAFVNGKVIFDAVGFSSYTVDEEPAATPTIQATASPTESTEPSASPQATLGPMSEESNELKIRCPVGIVAEDNVTVSAFYTPDGAPTCVGTALQVTAFANGSYQGVTYQSCDSGTGLHRFVINTTATGTFQIAARYDRLQAQCTFDAVGRTPTPTPELSEWLILAVGLAAFGLVSQNPKRH